MNKNMVFSILAGSMVFIGVVFTGLKVEPVSGYMSIENLVGEKAPNISLPNLTNGKIESVLKGSDNKLSVIVLWSIWCEVCPKYLKRIKDIKVKYTINTIGILYQDDPVRAVTHLKNMDNPFSVN